MAAIRVMAILSALGTPALLAPLLVRVRGRMPPRRWGLLAAIISLIPLSAPWALAGTQAPLIIALVAILGVIVMLKAIDWLACPRREDELVRVRLALTFWPALEIEEVGIRIPGLRRRMALVARRVAAGAAGLLLGLSLTALGQQRLDLPHRGIWLDSSFKALEICFLAGGADDLLVAALGLAGYRGSDAFRYPILAHSVPDFWSRYNVWIHRWLKRHVFEPIGRRRRRPVLGILAVFVTAWTTSSTSTTTWVGGCSGSLLRRDRRGR